MLAISRRSCCALSRVLSLLVSWWCSGLKASATGGHMKLDLRPLHGPSPGPRSAAVHSQNRGGRRHRRGDARTRRPRAAGVPRESHHHPTLHTACRPSRLSHPAGSPLCQRRRCPRRPPRAHRPPAAGPRPAEGPADASLRAPRIHGQFGRVESAMCGEREPQVGSSAIPGCLQETVSPIRIHVSRNRRPLMTPDSRHTRCLVGVAHRATIPKRFSVHLLQVRVRGGEWGGEDRSSDLVPSAVLYSFPALVVPPIFRK